MRSLIAAVLLIAPVLATAQDSAAPAAPAPAVRNPAKGQVYKWVDSKGVIHYTDKPPSENARPAALPPLQTYKRGAAPPIEQLQGAASTPAKPAARPGMMQIELVAPNPDETFRGGERTVPVSVVVVPTLTADFRLVYLLDGEPRSGSVSETSYEMTDVERGSHQISVMLTTADGAEVARTSPVTVHVKPPVARPQAP